MQSPKVIFSFVVPATDEQITWFTRFTGRAYNIINANDKVDPNCRLDRQVERLQGRLPDSHYFFIHYEPCPRGLWFHSNGGLASVESVTEAIVTWLAVFPTMEPVQFAWIFYAHERHINEVGGGAVHILPGQHRSINTWDWLKNPSEEPTWKRTGSW